VADRSPGKATGVVYGGIAINTALFVTERYREDAY